MNNIYDLAIIGSGVAGAFAALKISKDHKGVKTILFDTGSRPGKRKRQTEGFLGCMPGSDGKLYLNDLSQISNVVGGKRANAANKWFNHYAANIFDLKTVKDKSPSINASKRINKAGFDIQLNNYIQLYPKDIHNLSRHMSNIICHNKNMTLSFDNEIVKISKHKNNFIITSSIKEFICKKIIICTGRSGWRWTKELYSSFGIIENNDTAKFGIRVETTANVMKDFNKSNCNITNNELEIGPLSWNGTVVPEDHIDFVISSFRSNEQRWKSDKVSFNLIGNRYFENGGFEQTSRLGQLTFILANERVSKEKISLLVAGKSKISIIPEYDWLPNAIQTISSFMPDLAAKGYFHIPTILPLMPKIKVGNNLLTELDGLYCAGEASGTIGLLAAITTGIISADAACK